MSVAFLSILGWPLENVEPVHFGQEVSLTLSSCRCRDSFYPEKMNE